MMATCSLTATELTQQLKEAAVALGFDLVGVCPAVTPNGINRLYDWIDAGLPGEMNYFVDRRDAYSHPGSVLPGVRSIVMLAINYAHSDDGTHRPGLGKVARYARGKDYHDVLWERLDRLGERLGELAPHGKSRGVVDTAPLLERDFARLAGLGWIGKNTLLLNKSQGSWFVLGALLTDLELTYGQPHELDHCGSCTACLDACPTGAFVGPHQLDPRRCISYLTIEHRSPIPMDLRVGIGDWVFGCDVCQEVCPWNHKAPSSPDAMIGGEDGLNQIDLVELLTMSEAEFRAEYRNTPLWRPKRRGMLRNAAIVLGNQRDERSLPALIKALDDSEALVRGAASWALGQFNTEATNSALSARLHVETDETVRGEITAALETAHST